MRVLVALARPEESESMAWSAAEIVRARRIRDVALFHILRVPPELGEHGGAEKPELEEAIEAELDRKEEDWFRRRKDDVEVEIFGPVRRALEDEGLFSVHTTVSADTQGNIAAEIIDKARRDGYGGVIVGREGGSSAREILPGTASKVANELRDRSVWIVDTAGSRPSIKPREN